MVSLVEGADGVVTLSFLPPYRESDEAEYLAALERIAALDESFQLVTIFAGGGKLSRSGERDQALWFKRTRGRMNELCRGAAIVRPGASEAMAAAFRRLWTFPIAVATTEAEARRTLAALTAETRP